VVNPPKAKGTAAETAVVRLAEACGIPARRVALAGAADQGDVHLWDGRVVIEVKSRKSWPSWLDVDAWFREAESEAARVGNCDVAALVVKRPGHGPARAGDWFAWVRMADLSWWYAQHETPANAATVNVLTPQQRVMLPLGDLLALLERGHRG
jgi:hypothetical protein